MINKIIVAIKKYYYYYYCYYYYYLYGANSTIQFTNAPHICELNIIRMNNNNRKIKSKIA